MDLYKLKTFTTAALCLNFNQAAKQLNCAQSTVSVQIQALENEIGAPLFRRVKKKVLLTQAGEKMLGYAEKLLALEQEALADVSGRTGPCPTLALMVPEAMALTLLPPVMETFCRRYPGVGLDISNCSAGGLEHDLLTESVDLAFIFSRQINSNTLNQETLYTRRLRLAARPGHPLEGKGPLCAEDLKDQVLFLPKAGCGLGLEFRQMLFSGIIRPTAVMALTSIQAIKTCVMAGNAITLLPEDTMADDISMGKLRLLNWPEDLSTDLLMLWQKDKKIGNALAFLMSLFRQAGCQDMKGSDRL